MRKYDDEFKRQAVRKIYDGQTVASVSRELGVSENQLHAWKKRRFEEASGSELVRDFLKFIDTAHRGLCLNDQSRVPLVYSARKKIPLCPRDVKDLTV